MDAIASEPGPVPAQVRQKKAARQGLGRTGERMAGEALVRQGYSILERNFRCQYGEVDLVAEHEGELVFVEVKTRRGMAYGRPEEAVTFRKQQKILEVASYYLDVHDCSLRSWRIDVVAVEFYPDRKVEEKSNYPHARTRHAKKRKR